MLFHVWEHGPDYLHIYIYNIGLKEGEERICISPCLGMLHVFNTAHLPPRSHSRMPCSPAGMLLALAKMAPSEKNMHSFCWINSPRNRNISNRFHTGCGPP